MTYQCERCHADNTFEPLTRTEGDLEVRYLKCAECGAEIVASVSDAILRDNIARYTVITDKIKNGSPTERLIRRAQRLKADNVKRSRALRDNYLSSRKEV